MREETGLEVELLELVGIYSDPRHVFDTTTGKWRQEFSVCFYARPVKGTLTIGSESLDVRYFALADIDDLPMVVNPTAHRRQHGGWWTGASLVRAPLRLAHRAHRRPPDPESD